MECPRPKKTELEFRTRPIVLEYEVFGLIESTAFDVDIDGQTEELHCENTTLWVFDDPRYRHIEWNPGNGQLIALRGVDDRLFQAMAAAGFPHYYRPRPDRATYEWYIATESNNDHREIAAYLLSQAEAAEQAAVDVGSDNPG